MLTRSRIPAMSIRRACIESLEQRKLLSVAIPSGYAQIGEAITVDATSSAVVSSGLQLESGIQYFIKASGIHQLALNPTRQADAQFYEKNPGDWARGSKPHLRVTGVSSWGSTRDTEGEYGAYVTGNSAQLTAWVNDSYYGDNAGSLQLQVFQKVILDSLTVSDPAHVENAVTDSGTLYVEEGGDHTATIAITGLVTPGAGADKALWRIDEPYAYQSQGNFASDSNNVTLTVVDGNRVWNVKAGVDNNGNGNLDASEVTKTVGVTVVDVESLTVTDLADNYSITNPPGAEMYVAEAAVGTPGAGSVKIKIEAEYLPTGPGAGSHILWDVLGGTISGTTPGNFGGTAAPEVTLTPGTGNRAYDVKIGFDNNADGSLQLAEIDHIITVRVLKLDWKIVSKNTDGSDVTDAMELDSIKYNFKVDGLPSGGTNLTYHVQKPDGSYETSNGYYPVPTHDMYFIPPNVLDGDTDHKYAFETYYTIPAPYGSRTFTSPKINIDIFELWIKSFRDDATGKEWKVSIGDAISYEAISGSKATDWSWDMEDGVPDAWNPTGGNAKSGSSMVIPFSDEERASNSWFGDAYGTVTVKCTSGLGRSHTLHSTDMTGAPKAKVFFDPNKAVDGNAPAAGKPPAWFVFWNQTGAGNSDVSYDHSIAAGTFGVTSFGYNATTGVVVSVSKPKIGAAASGSSTVGLTSTTITGIDTFFMTVRHEMLHYDELSASIGAANADGDYIAASLEGDKNGNGIIDGGETDPALYSTHGTTPSGPSDAEWRAYWMEGNVWNADIGSFDSVDWSKGGKQW